MKCSNWKYIKKKEEKRKREKQKYANAVVHRQDTPNIFRIFQMVRIKLKRSPSLFHTHSVYFSALFRFVHFIFILFFVFLHLLFALSFVSFDFYIYSIPFSRIFAVSPFRLYLFAKNGHVTYWRKLIVYMHYHYSWMTEFVFISIGSV